MNTFAEIDPKTVATHPNLIAKLPDYRKPHKTWYLLLVDDYLIIANATFKERDSKWLHYQIEFPKRGLLWYLDTLKEKFFNTAAEGGLPKGVFHAIGEVDGERLYLGRAFNADGHGGGGYAFTTLDRKDAFLDMAKEYIFSDALLFEHGLMDLFEQIAAKIRSGEL
ncbi:MAG: hypothetical protein II007_07650 [Gammaproteobacteria bacterium]|nr:hypothetical protein [Gammaproteobacteria bacterium]